MSDIDGFPASHGDEPNRNNSGALPTNVDFRHLKLQAKDLLRACRAGDEIALARMDDSVSGSSNDGPKLADAQLAIAREYGFDSWAELKIFVEIAANSFAKRLDTFLREGWSWGDSRRAQAVFDQEPGLAEADFFAACVAANAKAVEFFLNKNPQHALTKGGPRKWSPILYATWSYLLPKREENAIQVIQLLLDHGANPNDFWRERWNSTRESALYGCVDANCPRAAKVLLEAGANPNDGESLYHACENGNLEMLETLGGYGLNEDDISYCIKHAMDFRWDKGVQWFLEHDADPNAVHPAVSETSLHWAVKRNCSPQIVQRLLDAGADPNARTLTGVSAYLGIKGYTPLDFALRLGRDDVQDILLKAGTQPNEDLSNVDRFVIAAANGNRRDAIQLLQDDPGLFYRVDANDQRLITHVAQMGCWRGVQLMVELGWRPDQPGGWMDATPLHWAICLGEPTTVDFLVDRGASPSHDVGGYFQTPLHTLLQCRWNESAGSYQPILRRLIAEKIEIPEGWFPCGNEALDATWREAYGQSERR